MGVTVLAILGFIFGVLTILGALALLGLGAIFAAYTGGGLAFIFGIILVLLGFLELYIGYGFWTLKRSAWSLGIVVFAASLIVQLVEAVLGYGDFSSFIINLIVYGIILYYLFTPAVKAAFGVTGDAQTAIISGLPMGASGAAAAPPAAPPPAAPPAETYTPPPAPAAAPEPPAAPPPASSWGGSSETPSGGESHDGGDGDTA